MKRIQVYHVDAFTDQPFGGNAAGVVPKAEDLTEVEMQKIARELNLSETAFVLPSSNQDADVKVRYFTPSSEIDFCGHATIALSWILATEYGWIDKSEEIKLETNIGIIPVQWSISDGELQSVTMTQVAPKVKDLQVDLPSLCRLVGVAEEDIDPQYPIKLAYTGNWHILLPIKTKMAIDSVVPMMEELALYNRELQVSTTHLYTFKSETDAMLYTRDFAPAVGIPEDPVTGSANGALAGYLVMEGILEKGKNHSFKIDQGNSMGRPGTLDINIQIGTSGPIIRVGGKAVPTISGTITF